MLWDCDTPRLLASMLEFISWPLQFFIYFVFGRRLARLQSLLVYSRGSNPVVDSTCLLLQRRSIQTQSLYDAAEVTSGRKNPKRSISERLTMEELTIAVALFGSILITNLTAEFCRLVCWLKLCSIVVKNSVHYSSSQYIYQKADKCFRGEILGSDWTAIVVKHVKWHKLVL